MTRMHNPPNQEKSCGEYLGEVTVTAATEKCQAQSAFCPAAEKPHRSDRAFPILAKAGVQILARFDTNPHQQCATLIDELGAGFRALQQFESKSRNIGSLP